LIDDLRAKVLPIIDQTSRAVTALADLAESLRAPEGDFRQLIAGIETITAGLQRGEGVVGRLLTDSRLVDQLQATVSTTAALVDGLRPIVGELQKTARDVSALSGAARRQTEAIPGLIADANTTVASLRQITQDVSQTSPGLPALLAQTQQTTLELERLLLQLRSLWLLGGSGQPPPGERPLSPLEVRP
jgi:phospholipid/cholesterol/gamma-HCH transport system substrate-binding protein